MSDTLYPIAIGNLARTILSSLKKGEIQGIYQRLFFNPMQKTHLKTSIFGQKIETPIGLAAGPHTQMAQNIISGWLCGARYIELKTIQTLDEIEVSKPCIDISDEGYNCEWSQELKIAQSYEEYLKAWILIHILRHELKYPKDIGTVFNMSVGYDMQGILEDNVQWFFNKMKDCSHEKDLMISEIRTFYPEIDNIQIPDTISNNITLSTMHGCPADEIGTIGNYLLKEKKLHTFIKLNPTLLGKKDIDAILSGMGYETVVPDVAFEHDITFEASCNLIRDLSDAASKEDLDFGIKLTNTLESINNRDVFADESMYMSGKALHPISINVAAKLRKTFPDLAISFCGGVDHGNLQEVLNCGLFPVTVCSDILKPGGYTKLLQYLDDLILPQINGDHNPYLYDHAEKVKRDRSYTHIPKSIKTERTLGEFDCIFAPCTDTCPTHQNIPAYLAFAHDNNSTLALKTILETNPFPVSTGMICDHSCQSKCTRINYDDPLRIRDIKRFIAENTDALQIVKTDQGSGTKISVIGAGPSGLSCAYYLALAGCEVDVYESKPYAGGMLADAVPEFRLSGEALDWDIRNIARAGVNIRLSEKVTKEKFKDLQGTSDFIYIAAGAQKAAEANIPGGKGIQGVWDPLEFLASIRKGERPALGKKVIVLGGGNTAMDVSRTAKRLGGSGCEVSIVYRRTRNEMPADSEEIAAAVEEGIRLVELAAPARIHSTKGKLTALECHRMKLEKSEKGERPKPIVIPDREFTLEADAIIPAFGQEHDIDFINHALLETGSDKKTKIKNVFIGGDASRGASFLIKAIADGKDVAKKIISQIAPDLHVRENILRPATGREEHHLKLSKVIPGIKAKRQDVGKRGLQDQVDLPMSGEEVREEAARCLNCDEICDICVTVCPNRANAGYEIQPLELPMNKIIFRGGGWVAEPDGVFKIEQRYQTLNIADLCNECGNCTTFCPTAGRPFADKPNIALSEESFRSLDTGYMKTKEGMQYKRKGTLYNLKHMDEGYRFYNDDFIVDMDKDYNVLHCSKNNPEAMEISLYPAVKMVIMEHAVNQL